MKIILTSWLAFMFAFGTGAATHAQGIEWETLNAEVEQLYGQHQYDRAIVVAKKALAVAEQDGGADSRSAATSLYRLAELYYAQGQYAHAEPLYKRAVAIREKALSLDHPNVNLSPENIGSRRSLVIIVPGTWGNGPDSLWPTIIDGRATFGSELRRAMGPESDIYPFVWASANSHSNRMEAAKNLANIIDEKAPGYARVFLVGHSYGGNIAMAAAGMCHSPIEMTVCIATPSPYLNTRNHQGERLLLPIYCTLASRNNIRCIVTLSSTTDTVQDGWADLFKGLSENQALDMTRQWREENGHPRLAEDGISKDLFGSSNIKVGTDLRIADKNVKFQSFVEGIASHSATHSRRMGVIVGNLLREGLTMDQHNYLDATVQPFDADDGRPVALREHETWLKTNEIWFELVGWRLSEISIKLHDRAIKKADHFNGLPPSPYLQISAKDGKVCYTSECYRDTMTAKWATDYVLVKGGKAILRVWDYRLFRNDADLGGWVIDGTQQPPATVTAMPDEGADWSATMAWTAVHY